MRNTSVSGTKRTENTPMSKDDFTDRVRNGRLSDVLTMPPIMTNNFKDDGNGPVRTGFRSGKWKRPVVIAIEMPQMPMLVSTAKSIQSMLSQQKQLVTAD